MNAMRGNAIAERRRSRHAAHSESAEIGVAGRALVLSLRDSNRQRTINSGGERDEDARSSMEERLPPRRCRGSVRFFHTLSLHWAPLLEKGGKGVGYTLGFPP